MGQRASLKFMLKLEAFLPRAILVLIVTVAFGAFGFGTARAEVPVIEQAWAAYGAAELEAYLTINNATSGDVNLVKVVGVGGATTMLHDRDHKERPAGLYIPIHSELFMQPGGIHVALLDIAPSVGDAVPVTVEFAGKSSQTVSLEVMESPDEAPAHHSLH